MTSAQPSRREPGAFRASTTMTDFARRVRDRTLKQLPFRFALIVGLAIVSWLGIEAVHKLSRFAGN